MSKNYKTVETERWHPFRILQCSSVNFILSCAFLVALSMPPSKLYAGNDTLISISCNRINFSTCMQRLSKSSGINVSYDKDLENISLNFSITNATPRDCLIRAIQETGLDDLALAYDINKKYAHISRLNGNNSITTDTPPQKNSSEQATPEVHTGISEAPTPEDERLAKSPPDLDTTIVIPGENGQGEVEVTLREMVARSQRGELSRPDPKTVFIKDASGNDITWGQLVEYSKKASVAPDEDAVIERPDGSSITLRELKASQARSKVQKEQKNVNGF